MVTALRNVKKWWMAFARALGWLNARLLLTVFYFVILGIPALILRLLRKDPLLRKPGSSESYWAEKDAIANTPEQARHQF